MLLRNRCLLLASVVALAGSVACSAPTPPSYGKTAKASAGLVYNARSTQTSAARLGITRWHSIVEPKTQAVVFDGQDAKGNVGFITSLRVDKATNTLHVETFAPSKAAMVIDMKTGKVLSNTLTRANFASFASALTHDWKQRQEVARYANNWQIAGAALGLAAATVLFVVALPAIVS
ncbi:MAG TPA: hypothetical protein VLT33_36775, partial [Labilithrix sp.]|nr:hypothetical protein [Labilithrix sp.]